MNFKFRAPRPQTRAGFSLIELLTVMVVVGLVSTISAGRIREIMVQQRLARAATAIQTNAEAAFAIAVRNRRPIRIAWNASTMQMSVTDRAGTTSYRKVGLGADPYGLTSGTVTFSTSPLEVYPNGLANGSLSITLTSNGVTKTISISRAGLVKFQ